MSGVLIRHDEVPGYAWTMAEKAPPDALAPYLTYTGYEERPDSVLQRREVPSGGVVLILLWDGKLDIREQGDAAAPGMVGSFVAGMGDTSVLIDTHGAQQGIQLNLTPLGAYRLLGLPMSELANQVVALEDVQGGPAIELVDRLATAPTWDDRYALLDETLLGWLDGGPDPDPAVAWAWNQLDATAGGLSIGELADETGWSRRHFIKQFRDQVGLAPKATARVLRFNEALRLLRERRPGTSITDVAMACGYTDHSHLTREFKRLAGNTPSAWLAAQSTESFGAPA